MISKERCLHLIKDLVCPRCGKESLEPMETVDNSNNLTYWAGCNDCQRFSWGVKKEVYSISEKLVREYDHIAYGHLGSKYDLAEQEKENWYKDQIDGTHRLVYSFIKIQNELNEKH